MLPKEVLNKIENLSQNHKEIINSARIITHKYRNESGCNKILVSTMQDSQAYSAYRMPATYEACNNVFSKISQVLPENHYNSLLDVGTGTGSSVLACIQYFLFNKITCLERENSMITCAKYLLNDVIKNQNIQWKQEDILKYNNDTCYDMITSSYVLNELDDKNRLIVINKLWNITNKILVVIEPGTPEGFRQITQIRNELINKGANLIAPCTHTKQCKLTENDWCHFSCRVPRTKLLKQIKNAEVPYEDEKFCYMVFSKDKYNLPDYRILKHPYYRPKVVELQVCSKNTIKKMIITKNQKEIYPIARHFKIGDSFNAEKPNKD